VEIPLKTFILKTYSARNNKGVSIERSDNSANYISSGDNLTKRFTTSSGTGLETKYFLTMQKYVCNTARLLLGSEPNNSCSLGGVPDTRV
jgi:hypothetical protein